MLTRLVEFSLRYRGVVLLLACLVLGYGIYVADHAKLDVFPDFVPPQVVVQTEAPGLAPEQVETLVTRPLETVINGLGALTALRSESIQGLSAITVVFADGTDIFRARQSLAERLTQVAGELPVGVMAPKMEPMTSSTMDLLMIGLTSDKRSAMELRSFADWRLKPRLLSVPGVAKCTVYGGDVREIQIQVLPDRLRSYDLALQDVITAARSTIGVRGAGFIEGANQHIMIQTQSPEVTAATLAEVPIDSQDGRTVRMKDVARVAEDPQFKVGDAVIMGEPGVLLTLSSQYGANTMEVTRSLESALNEMTPLIEGREIRYHAGLHRPATFITASLHNVRHSLIVGGILVSVILFIFLFNVRAAVISLTAIPLSLLTAIVVMDKLGFSLNTITLGGLAIALGEVVDDAIIDIENIFRRLRENQHLGNPRPLFNVVLDASIEVRSAVVYATFVVILVFVPILTLTGLQGKFFAPLGWAYIIAILASLIVALTLTPALALMFFRHGVKTDHDPIVQRALKAAYTRMLAAITHHAGWLIAAVAIICVVVIATLPFFGQEFLPEFREGHFVLQLSAAPGTSLAEMRRLGQRISTDLLAIPNVQSVAQQIGRAELGTDIVGPEKCEFHLNLKENVPGAAQSVAQKQIKDVLARYPGITSVVTTFLGDRISESITGEKAAVVINLFGDDLDKLDDVAPDIADTIRKLPGAGEVAVKTPPKGPRLVVRPRPQRLAQLGFRAMDVLDAVRAAYQGEVVGQTYFGAEVTDVSVVLEPAAREFPEQVGRLLISNRQGARVPLSELADVYQDTGRSLISRQGARRRQTITCEPSGVDAATFVASAKKAIEKIELPEGAYVEFAGEAETEAAARNELLVHSAIAGVGILILLAVVFGNIRNLLLLLVNLPFALVGGILAIILTSPDHTVPALSLLFHHPTEWLAALKLGTLSIGAMVGFVTLFGITTRNSIMLISHFEHLVRLEGMEWGPEAALRGASERLIPILMTALVTALGLLPLALGTGEAGREIEGPMAIVILGGLVTSTALNLLVMPSLALKFGRFARDAESGAR
jgi:CzcA family heavy metal efflux pump